MAVGATFTPASLESAIANGDTRATISILNVHTNESATVTFKRDGYYSAEGLKQLSWLLRDYRRDEATNMSPRLFDVLWDSPGSGLAGALPRRIRLPLADNQRHAPPPFTARGRASPHMLGEAIDTSCRTCPSAKMRAIAMHLQEGGVGYYPTPVRPSCISTRAACVPGRACRASNS